MKAVGCYIFGGGFSLGVKQHAQVLCHLEGAGGYGVPSVRRNQHEIPCFFGPQRWPIRELAAARPDFVYGNPPCAEWSPIGRVINYGSSHEQWASDKRVDCVRELFSLLEALEPAVWAWESVPQAFSRGRSLVDELTKNAAKLGYAADYVLHNAMYLGARQHRKRFFCVFTRVEIDWTCEFSKPVTVREALASMPSGGDDEVPTSNVKPRFWRLTREGEPLRLAHARYVEKTGDAGHQRQGFATKKAAWDRVSPAIIGQRIFHPGEPRLFSVAESLWLSGFPVDYRMTGGRHARVHEIARGVLPPVGKWLASNVARAFDRGHDAPVGRTRVVDFFSPPGEIREETRC